MDVTKLKAGNYIMIDMGGVAYATFAFVENVEKRTNGRIVLNLKDIYKRMRLTNDGTMNEDVFTYEHHDNYHISAGSLLFDRIYKITKTEYDAVEKSVRKYFEIREKSCEVLRKIYFEQKRKK